MTPELRRRLEAVLREGQRRGLLGPGPIEAQLDHALAFGLADANPTSTAPADSPGPTADGPIAEPADASAGARPGEAFVQKTVLRPDSCTNAPAAPASTALGPARGGAQGSAFVQKTVLRADSCTFPTAPAAPSAGGNAPAGGSPGEAFVQKTVLRADSCTNWPVSGLAGRALDLGSGGGLPGLVLAVEHPESTWTLLDSRQRSASFLREAVAELGLGDRVTVLEARAEDVGRSADHRGRYELVTARGFGPPAVTAECAAPLLAVHGRLVVSEPPGSAGERWSSGALEQLGMRVIGVAAFHQGGFAVLEQASTCPDAYPRRSGIPAKRPLFVSRETSSDT